MPALYPVTLVAITPYGIADFTEFAPAPGALVALDQRELTQQLSITGTTLVTLPPDVPRWQLRLAVPDATAVPLDVALPLQQCRVGDIVTWVENHTRRDRTRVWDAQVVSADSGTWVAGNAVQGDYFTLAMTFLATTDPTEG
ncbi:hypothetical protein [Deinococcus rufus]|uniref:Uncharacterized protein n=1 Tax=Deinococcus rufus TaxID=2136097 RepID=A0ABV7Z9W1_9DEIO